MEDKVLFTIDERNIARITLNRHKVHNALNQKMLQKLIEIFKKLQEIPSLKALIIRGNGKSFCAGADLSWITEAAYFTDDRNYEEAHMLSQMLYFLDTLPIPTIAYAHGAVMGGGIGILACADIVIAEAQTIFGFPETRLGLIPAVISPYVLRAISLRHARRFFLTGEKFDTSMAKHIGLIHEILDADHAENEIDKFIYHILAGGPKAIREAKSFLFQITGTIPEHIRLQTTEAIASIRRSEEAQQGVKAFLEKTRPPWVLHGSSDD